MMKRDITGRFRAKTAAIRHGHPSRALRVIAVAGEYGASTTALLLGEILEEARWPTMVLTPVKSHLSGAEVHQVYDTSAASLQRQLARARKKGMRAVVFVLTDELANENILETLEIDMSVITSVDFATEKLLGRPVDFLVVPGDFDMEQVTVPAHQAISYGEGVVADARIQSSKLFKKGTEIELVVDHQTTLPLATYLVGKANTRNVAAAVAAAYVLGIDTEHFAEGVARLEEVLGNYMPIKTDKPYDVAVDSAAHEVSYQLALQSAKTLAKRRLIVACDESVTNTGKKLAQEYADRVIVVGIDKDEINGVTAAENTQSAALVALRAAKKDDYVLLLGTSFGAESGNATIAHTAVERITD